MILTEMRKAEGQLASGLGAEGSSSPTGRSADLATCPLIRYVKSHRVTYLCPVARGEWCPRPGQRTPLFTLGGTPASRGTSGSPRSPAGTRGRGSRCEAANSLPLACEWYRRGSDGGDPAAGGERPMRHPVPKNLVPIAGL